MNRPNSTCSNPFIVLRQCDTIFKYKNIVTADPTFEYLSIAEKHNASMNYKPHKLKNNTKLPTFHEKQGPNLNFFYITTIKGILKGNVFVILLSLLFMTILQKSYITEQTMVTLYQGFS